MPIHDWSRVDAGIFHDLHLVWIGLIKTVLNESLLPEPYYALAEPVLGNTVPDVLTLRESSVDTSDDRTIADSVHDDSRESPVISSKASVLVQDLGPPETYASLSRRIAIKNALRSDEVVAVIELVSRANKESRKKTDQFLDKTLELLRNRIHVLLVDLQPRTRFTTDGFHSMVCESLGCPPLSVPSDHELETVAYQSLEGGVVRSHLVPLKVGVPLPDMPVFLSPHRYVRIPLEKTYLQAFESLPRRFKKVLETE